MLTQAGQREQPRAPDLEHEAVRRIIDAARLHRLSDLAPLCPFRTTVLRAFSLDRPADVLRALFRPVADLNESSFRTPSRSAHGDLPVPLSGTGRGRESR